MPFPSTRTKFVNNNLIFVIRRSGLLLGDNKFERMLEHFDNELGSEPFNKFKLKDLCQKQQGVPPAETPQRDLNQHLRPKPWLKIKATNCNESDLPALLTVKALNGHWVCH
jgi:hypothetical protein